MERGQRVALVDLDKQGTSRKLGEDGKLGFPVIDGINDGIEDLEAFDSVVCDHPGHADENSDADMLVIPVEPARAAFESMMDMLDTLDADKRKRSLIVINKIDARKPEHLEVAEAIADYCAEEKLTYTRVGLRTVLERAMNNGTTVFDMGAMGKMFGNAVARSEIEALLDWIQMTPEQREEMRAAQRASYESKLAAQPKKGGEAASEKGLAR